MGASTTYNVLFCCVGYVGLEGSTLEFEKAQDNLISEENLFTCLNV